MRNKKVIVINGFQRGGTNILYNIFQSHPMVCSANDLETGQIISQNYRIPNRKKIGYLIKRFKLLLYRLLNKKFILNSFIVKIFGILIDELFYNYKKKNYTSLYNKFKYENQPYSLKEVKNSVLCLKSVHNDIRLTKFFSRVYDNIFFIGLVRNGYALCESWIRRGKTVEIAAYRYNIFCKMMIDDSKKIRNYIIIKFEDILKEPFKVATKLYIFTQLDPIYLEKLRFKSKKVLTKDGEHKVQFGRLDSKYWFDSKNIRKLFNPSINEIHIKKLLRSDKETFEIESKLILDYFQYSD